jgi:16S rRNA (guanine527-N7)-methyltransferase
MEGLAEALEHVIPADLPRRKDFVAGAVGHAERVLAANESLNLTRITDARDVAVKHVLDCVAPWRRLAQLAAVGSAPEWADLGSGAGYPGILLALLLPRVRVRLVESTQKKALFLAQVVRELRLANVLVVAERAEELIARTRFDVVTARAVGSVRDLLRLLKGVRANWGRLVLYKGPGVEEEIAQAAKDAEKQGLAAAITARYELPDDAGSRCLLEYARSSG